MPPALRKQIYRNHCADKIRFRLDWFTGRIALKYWATWTWKQCIRRVQRSEQWIEGKKMNFNSVHRCPVVLGLCFRLLIRKDACMKWIKHGHHCFIGYDLVLLINHSMMIACFSAAVLRFILHIRHAKLCCSQMHTHTHAHSHTLKCAYAYTVCPLKPFSRYAWVSWLFCKENPCVLKLFYDRMSFLLPAAFGHDLQNTDETVILSQLFDPRELSTALLTGKWLWSRHKPTQTFWADSWKTYWCIMPSTDIFKWSYTRVTILV